MKNINGLTEVNYLLGAIAIVERELLVAARRDDTMAAIEASQRLDSLKDCLVRVLKTDNTTAGAN